MTSGFLKTAGADDEVLEASGFRRSTKTWTRHWPRTPRPWRPRKKNFRSRPPTAKPKPAWRKDATAEEIWQQERRLLDRMQRVADTARDEPGRKDSDD